MTRREVLEKIKECEQNQKFDEHVDPIDYNNYYPVDENFHYEKKGFKEKIKNFWLHNFVVKPYMWKINKLTFKTKVVGRENLKGVKSAIITCNHVNMFDCLVVKYALRGNPLYITAGYFNNQKGKFGDFMRAGGMMPFGQDMGAIRNFNKAIENRLNKGSYILFYPEASMWWNYEKPRPFKNGAFQYAVKHHVPVIPCFITFITTDKLDEEGLPIKKFIIHIGKPIYEKEELSEKENVDYLRETDFNVCKNVYEKFYDEKLIYSKITKEKDKKDVNLYNMANSSTTTSFSN